MSGCDFVNVKGYIKASKELIALNKFEEAKNLIDYGLKKFPNNIKILINAIKIYRKSGDRAKSLELSKIIIKYHPENFIGFQKGAEDLIVLNKFEEAENLLQKFTKKNVIEFSKINSYLKRRKQIPELAKRMKIISRNKYPSFCLAGNCQSVPIYKWLSINFPSCQINKLTAYQNLKSQSEINEWINKASISDFVLMLPVRDNYKGLKFGSNFVKSLLGSKVRFISYPGFFLEVFHPFFGRAKNLKGGNLGPKDIDETKLKKHQYSNTFHDFLAMRISKEKDCFFERFCQRIFEINQSNSFCSKVILEIGRSSIIEFEKRHPSYVHVLKNNINNGISWTINHPKVHTLNEIYKILWEKEFALPQNTFLKLDEHASGDLIFPIPEFVLKSIFMNGNDVPWNTSVNLDKKLLNKDSGNYLYKIKNCINFYKSNPEILEWNTNNKKLISAEEFLTELRI